MTKFDNELNLIVNDTFREFAKYCVDHIHERFFEEAASTTGKYHPEYALGKGGLYRHTCAAVAIAESLMQLDCCKEMIGVFGEMSAFGHDAVILALMMHDTCKCGKDWTSRYTVHDHPILAAEFVQELGNSGEFDDYTKQFVRIVALLIESHMGQWNTSKYSSAVLPLPETPMQKFVHVCDYLASRKFLLWDYDKEQYSD